MRAIGLFSILLIMMAMSCQQATKDLQQRTAENEKALSSNFKRFIDNAWNNKNMDTLKSVSVENYIKNMNGIQVAANQSEMQAHMKLYFIGFPDGKITIDETTVKDLNLFTHWTFSGTNTGVFGEAAPTGKKIQVTGYSKILFNDEGKMVREDEYYNELELLQQLGYTLQPPILE